MLPSSPYGSLTPLGSREASIWKLPAYRPCHDCAFLPVRSSFSAYKGAKGLHFIYIYIFLTQDTATGTFYQHLILPPPHAQSSNSLFKIPCVFIGACSSHVTNIIAHCSPESSTLPHNATYGWPYWTSTFTNVGDLRDLVLPGLSTVRMGFRSGSSATYSSEAKGQR